MLDLEPGELGLGEGTEASLLENLPYEQIMAVSEQPWEDMTATPLDLGPDFIPVAGQLDDAIIAALALRYVFRAEGPALLREQWPGPQSSLRIVLRLAHGGTAAGLRE